MKYQVHWSEEALNSLATIWLNADSTGRIEINRATANIDGLLSTDPEQIGESRDGNQRVFFLPPLVFSFSVYATDRAVLVLGVRPAVPRKSR